MILIVGQNPAKGMEDKKPFYGTRSGDVLFRWLIRAGIYRESYKLVNLWPKSGKLGSTKDLKLRGGVVVRDLDWSKIITVGKVADRYVRPLVNEKPLLNIPHPSGLNRKLNDHKAEDKIIKDIIKFLEDA